MSILGWTILVLVLIAGACLQRSIARFKRLEELRRERRAMVWERRSRMKTSSS